MKTGQLRVTRTCTVPHRYRYVPVAANRIESSLLDSVWGVPRALDFSFESTTVATVHDCSHRQRTKKFVDNVAYVPVLDRYCRLIFKRAVLLVV